MYMSVLSTERRVVRCLFLPPLLNLTSSLPVRREGSPPQPFKPRRVGRGVHDGVLNIPVSKVVLNQPRVRALVGKGEAARMAQHVRVCVNRQACAFAIGADRQPCRLTAQGAAPFADKEGVGLRLHFSTFCQPCLDSSYLVAS